MLKQQVLAEIWETYYSLLPNIRLGQCMRQLCSQFATKEHKCLSDMDGEVALAYFHLHYNDKYEQQFNMEGM